VEGNKLNDPIAEYGDHPALRLIQPGESIRMLTEVAGSKLLLTDRRLAVASGDRVALAES
jgi:hypothetical protein